MASPINIIGKLYVVTIYMYITCSDHMWNMHGGEHKKCEGYRPCHRLC